MNFFVYDEAGEIVNCIVANSDEIARDVVAKVYGANASIVPRKGASLAVDIGDTFDTAQREFTKRADGRKIVAEADTVEEAREV